MKVVPFTVYMFINHKEMAVRDSNYGGTTWKHFVSTFLRFTQIHVQTAVLHSSFFIL